MTEVDGIPVEIRGRHAEVARTVEEHAFRYYVLAQPHLRWVL